MTRLASPDGEDFPEAAMRHLNDAVDLKATQRYDSALYHLGFAIECSLKTSIMIGLNIALLPNTLKVHDLAKLTGEVLQLATHAYGTNQIALPQMPSEFARANWIFMRYHAPGLVTEAEVTAVEATARTILGNTVAQFYLSGDLP